MQTIIIKVPDDCEVQVVKKEEKKEPVIRTYQDLIDNRIPCKGYYINSFSELERVGEGKFDSCSDGNIAASEKVAKSMLAMAQISQLMPYYGGEITNEEWRRDTPKYSIIKSGEVIDKSVYTGFYQFLSFHTLEQRDEFLKWNLDLVKDYLMIE